MGKGNSPLPEIRDMSLADADIFLLCDVPEALDTLSETIRNASGRNDILIATHVNLALQLIEISSCKYVFVHLRAGALAATYVLDEFWKVHPQTNRFVLADAIIAPEALARCVLGAHHFISTPLSEESVSAAIARADWVKEIVRNDRMQSLVSKVRTLPTRPTFYTEIMRELRSESASAQSVAEIVSKDCAISTKLLQLANSASFGQSSRMSDPSTAVLLLGLETTGALVLSIEAFARFDKVKPLYFSIDKIWKHSQIVAGLAREICQRVACDHETTGLAYTAGLLHDIGKLIFAQNFEEQYGQTLREAEQGTVPLHELESQTFGANHAEAGAYLLALWGLPLPIIDAVAKHHLQYGRLPQEFNATTALHLADQLISGTRPPDEVFGEYSPEFNLISALADLPLLANARRAANRPHVAAPILSEPAPKPPNPSKERPRQNWAYVCVTVVILALFGASRALQRESATPAPHKGQDILPADSQPEPVRIQPETLAPRETFIGSAPKEIDAEPVKEALLPTTPGAGRPNAEAPKLKLQAIMYNGPRSRAVINGQTLQIGDTIERGLVISIDSRNVTVKFDTNFHTLTLY
jgi:putative nucleotidyltransferase with HDIG domain